MVVEVTVVGEVVVEVVVSVVVDVVVEFTVVGEVAVEVVVSVVVEITVVGEAVVSVVVDVTVVVTLSNGLARAMAWPELEPEFPAWTGMSTSEIAGEETTRSPTSIVERTPPPIFEPLCLKKEHPKSGRIIYSLGQFYASSLVFAP